MSFWANQVVEHLQQIHQVAQVALQLVDAILQVILRTANVATAWMREEIFLLLLLWLLL